MKPGSFLWRKPLCGSANARKVRRPRPSPPEDLGVGVPTDRSDRLRGRAAHNILSTRPRCSRDACGTEGVPHRIWHLALLLVLMISSIGSGGSDVAHPMSFIKAVARPGSWSAPEKNGSISSLGKSNSLK